MKGDFLDYVIVRNCCQDVFSGELESREGGEVTLRNARSLYWWQEGAGSLSELAMNGVKFPENCRFPCEVDKIVLLEIIEILYVSEEAKKNISEVPAWKI